MKLVELPYLSDSQKHEVWTLWNQEYPASLYMDSATDFEMYLQLLENPKHFVWLNPEERIIAWAYSFQRDRERWFALILHRDYHGLKMGTRILNRLKAEESYLCGWVIDHASAIRKDGTPYISPLGFYIKNGFEIIQEIRLETKAISAVKIIWRKNSK